MKTLARILFITCFTYVGFGQQGAVTIVQDKKIDEVIKLYQSSGSSSESYYFIQFGFGSSNWASSMKKKVELDFPELRPKIDFRTPNYFVVGGRFDSKMSAERKHQEVRKKYPSSTLPKSRKKKK